MTKVTGFLHLSINRNIIRLQDGRLLFGMVAGNRHISCYSSDKGLTWECIEAAVPGCRYEGIQRSFYTEALLFHTNSGRLMMMARVDYAYAVFENPLPCLPDYTTRTHLDNLDGGKMLFTYTVREIPPEGTGCVYPKVGVQAIVMEENPDGSIEADLNHDVIVIDDSTPDSMRNAGCFGNTILLPDGNFLTPFSYPLIDPEILELADNKEHMKEDVFDHYANMQDTYTYRYRDFLMDDPALTELYLKRSFSALFLYAHCANKGGIATAAVRWQF